MESNNMKRTVTLIILFSGIMACFSFTHCAKEDPVQPRSRYAGAEAQNIDAGQLSEAILILKRIQGFQSIVLGRNGVIAVEEYYNYAGAEVLHDVRSVTKSVMGLLIGIAIREGYLQSVDQTIGELLIETVVASVDSVIAGITIEDLLTMSCGLEWHELDGGNSYSNWYWSGNQVMWVLNQSIIHPPGHGFNYNTGSTHILSVILTRKSGLSALEFARSYLFESMGIQQSEWVIYPGERSYNVGGAGLQMTPRAMFDLGNLVLNNGLWDQEQVVPADWITQSVSRLNDTYGSHYGYLW